MQSTVNVVDITDGDDDVDGNDADNDVTLAAFEEAGTPAHSRHALYPDDVVVPPRLLATVRHRQSERARARVCVRALSETNVVEICICGRGFK
jgi:hypothetical protein